MLRLLLIGAIGWLAYRFAKRLNSTLLNQSRPEQPRKRAVGEDVIEAEYSEVKDDQNDAGSAS